MNLGIDTVLETGRISLSQWATLFETNDSTQPAVLAEAIKSLRYQKQNINAPYKKDRRSVNQVLTELANLEPTDTSFELSLLPEQIVEEAVELDKSMKTYIAASFQFNQNNGSYKKLTINYQILNC